MRRRSALLSVATLLGLSCLAPGAASPSRAAETPSAAAPPAARAAAPPAPAAAPKAASQWIVFCAPGYPGNTVQAQPAMDGFAHAVEKAAGWPAGRLGGVYYETEGGGTERLRKPDAVLAITTLPFFLQDGEKLGLKPHLAAERD